MAWLYKDRFSLLPSSGYETLKDNSVPFWMNATRLAGLFQRNVCCAGKGKDAGAYEQHYVGSLITLHDNYYTYVHECFGNSSMFHKALKDAFESFCNKEVAGQSSAEMMANYCNNLLRKVNMFFKSF